MAWPEPKPLVLLFWARPQEKWRFQEDVTGCASCSGLRGLGKLRLWKRGLGWAGLLGLPRPHTRLCPEGLRQV